MIKVEYLNNLDNHIGTCASCGKFSNDDPLMVFVTIKREVGGYNQTTFCLCDKCRKLMYKTI